MTFKHPIVPYYRAFLVGVLFLAGLLPAAENHNGFDYSDALVPPEEILWGGVPRDGIPPIHNPKFVDAEDAAFLRDKDRVLGVVRNGIAKAYPFKELRKNGQASFTDIVGGEELTIEWDKKEAYARVLDANGVGALGQTERTACRRIVIANDRDIMKADTSRGHVSCPRDRRVRFFDTTA